ncbi:RICIN domain-containing protein [Paenibacillus chondroitinus]|uniref:alpha-L-fucosidase n=1 Tax=Paenibacillus chondroitinus TaxID=59842 RepID=A0ABU6DC26_9BACL|nr:MULTISPECIES: RICIN domain-containing protein [Paenibacillus]MCY9656816.1 RICIN domain-containing protein [Paenibacillus anseongense]MEB4794466.1 RICIN domain-containing protein [Paenibacillus chondroitinus]
MKRIKKAAICLGLVSALLAGSAASAFADTYTNQKNYVDLRFGMFIHYNMGTYHDKEWVMPGQNPLSFNPATVNTDQWADAAKSAKMKYAVLTAKHHDGFALWPTKYGAYNVMNSAYPHDIVKQYVDSMRSRGILPGLYYSIWDRQQQIEKDSVSRADIDFMKGQLTELLTNYGEIPVLVIDGWAWRMGHQQAPYQEIREHVKRLQPNILIVDHNGQTQLWEEDALYFEEPKNIWAPAGNTQVANQGNLLVSGGWFWHPGMTTRSSASVSDIVYGHLKVLEPLYTNFLLNVSPNPQGALDTNVVNRLAEIGTAWTPDASRPPLPPQPIIMEHPITANSAFSISGSANHVVDGNLDYNKGSYVETVWQSSASFPQTVTLDLGYTYANINLLNYLPSQNMAAGQITSYSLYASTNGTNFSFVKSGTWAGDKTMKQVTFPAQTARYMKLQVNSAAGGYAAASELSVGSYTSDIPTPTGIDTFDSNAVYRIVNTGSGKALGVGSSLNSGAAVTQRTSADAADQQWIIDDLGLGNYKLINKFSGLALDVNGGSAAEGAPIVQGTDTETSASLPGKNQQWKMADTGNGYFKIVNVNSDKVLANTNGSASDGNPADQRTFNGSRNQLWQVQKIADNYIPTSYYKIVNLKSNKALDISGESIVAGADAIQSGYSGKDSQLWKVESIDSGQYKITNKKSGYALDVYGGSPANDAKVIQFRYVGSRNQKWNIQFIGKGLYQITSVRSEKALEVKDGSVLDGGGIVQNPYTSSPDEQWAIVKVQ